ncbi:unnamed protein product [Meganyctiphanes norvegica]|uniref:Uncharacterized protein n=1 Tax=Meganyctiphanes norvegica TaxID=48144 RepID=A0AAV2QRT2_MEGNR
MTYIQVVLNSYLLIKYIKMKLSLRELWCQCDGNSSAVPHTLLVVQKIQNMHEGVKEQALWYVGVVLSLYLLGIIIIIKKSGKSERSGAISAIAYCFTTNDCCKSKCFRKQSTGGQSSNAPRITISQQNQQSIPMPTGTNSKCKVFLEPPDITNEEISMMTSVTMT